MVELKQKKVDVFKEVEDEIIKELSKEKKYNSEVLKLKESNKRNLILNVFEKMLGKVLFGLKIEIVVKWKETVLFTYVIPKN